MSAGSQLLQFGAKIEVEREEVARAENLRDLHLIVDRPASVFASLASSDYQNLVDQFDGSLSLQIGLPNLPPLLNIDAGQLRLPLTEAVRAIQYMDDMLRLRLNLSVAKGPLLAHWGLNGGEHYMLPYLYADAFLRLLRAGLLALDKHLFAAPDRATLVVLEDGDLLLDGRMLSVSGLAGAKRIASGAKPLPAHTRQRLKIYRDTARESLIWAGFQLQNITPAHFITACRPVSQSNIRNPQTAIPNPKSQILDLLAAHALAANVLYTADWSVAGEGDFEAGFAGADNTAVINLPASSDTEVDMKSLARWAVWPFSGDSSDRLSILQNVGARRLAGKDGQANYALLQELFGRILNEARWHHRHFLNGRIESNFKALQDMGDYAASVATQIGAAIDSLTRGFNTALLGAVIVLILCTLAATVVGSQSQLVIRAGLIGYALYLLLFQGLYRMGSLLQNYLLLEGEIEGRMAVYEQRLGRFTMARAREMIAARKRQFRIWFSTTAVLLFVAAIVLILLAIRLPERLAPIA